MHFVAPSASGKHSKGNLHPNLDFIRIRSRLLVRYVLTNFIREHFFVDLRDGNLQVGGKGKASVGISGSPPEVEC